MSLALRSNASRRDKRNTSALPYSRPTKQAKRAPLFSLDGIVNWFKSFAGNEEPEQEVEATSNIAPPNPAAAALQERADDREGEATAVRTQLPPPPPPRRPQQSSSMLSLPGTYVPTPSPSTASVHQVQQQAQPTPSIPPPPPRAASRTSTSPLLDQGGSPAENLATVSAFLAGKNGQPLNRVEVAGLVSLIQNSMPDDEPYEPFRFSTSPTTPRDNTPPSGMNGDTSNKEQPRKTLAKNPNGTYRWQGAGSARPRNRYQSPAFGPSRAQPVRLKISPEQPTTDSKRRRVGDSATASSSQRAPAPTSSARPATTTTNATASGSGINGTGKAQPSSSFLKVPQASTSSASKTPSATSAAPPTTPSRIRTNVKTAPAVPSPLRQAWGQTDSPSPPANKPTHAANMMTELIKDATPPKKAFANPYQAALPGPMINKPKKPTGRKRAAAAKAEAAAKAAAEAEAKAKAAEEEARKQREAEMMSPQKIIEATVPKGAKRSRPPPELEKPKPDTPPSPTSRRSTRLKSPPPQPAFGSTQPKASVSPYKVTIEEVSDEDEPSPSKKAKTKGPSLAPIPAPRFTQPPVTVEVMDDTEMATEDSTPVVQPSQIIEPEDNTRRSASPTAASPAVPANPFNKTFGMKSSAPKAPSKLRYSIRPEDQSREQEGSFEAEKTEKSFGLHTPTPSLQLVAGEAQPSTFTMVKPSATPQQSNFQTESEVKDWVKTLPPTLLPGYTFTIPMSSPGAGPSTLKAREAAKAESISSLPKYDFTSPPASTAASKAPEVKSFDWAAAGMKPPSQPMDGSWKCGECTLITKDPAATKCAACDAPRAGAAPKPATQGFNWAAAGLKPPSQPADGSWKCGICGCVTPASGEKCVSCQEPRPGAKPAAPVQGFNWAAAGLKQPDLTGIWICSLCSGKSPQSESECAICKEPR